MGNLAIATNIAGLNAYRSLRVVSQNSQKVSEKFSSGYKINRAAHDAAGLAISEKMRNQIKSLNTAQRNVEDGMSLVYNTTLIEYSTQIAPNRSQLS